MVSLSKVPPQKKLKKKKKLPKNELAKDFLTTQSCLNLELGLFLLKLRSFDLNLNELSLCTAVSLTQLNISFILKILYAAFIKIMFFLTFNIPYFYKNFRKQ